MLLNYTILYSLGEKHDSAADAGLSGEVTTVAYEGVEGLGNPSQTN